jgi:nitrogen fixation/metabolism regulation signal transduction histidine kinase
MSGLNLAVVFHEVERAVRALHTAITEGAPAELVATQARDLMRLLEGFGALLRRDSKKKHNARTLLEAARRFSILRIRHHAVTFECPLLDGAGAGFDAKFSFGLVLGALNNLIDNSLYWLRVRWPNAGPNERQLRIEVADLPEGPAIVVADNGTGLQDDPARLVRPFVSRKPDGMGLGLYYSNLAMELNGGRLVFPDRSDVGLPDKYDGAVVALAFSGVK